MKFADQDRFLRYASQKQLSKKALNRQIYMNHKYLGYYPAPNYKKLKNRHNSLGYRGNENEIPKPVGQFRIVCLGGSTTYTSKIKDYNYSYPSLLEKELARKGYSNVSVINAGVPAWTSWESLINFELRVLDLNPDMIIIYHGFNDIHSRFVWPPDSYRGDHSGKRVSQGYIFMPSIFEYSSLIRIFHM